MRQRNLIGQIQNAVMTGKVTEPFKASDFPFLIKSQGFLAKHCTDNKGKYTKYFIRKSRGLYKLK